MFAHMYELYEDAFPPAERRSSDELKHVMETERRFVPAALMCESRFAGFFTYWTFSRFVYGEHFAIHPDVRGKNLGSEALNAFVAKSTHPVVVEVEMPDTPVAVRRVRFYERNGFEVVQQPYAQPYYDRSGRTLPMLLMSNNAHFVHVHFQQIKKTLYEEVYKMPDLLP